MAESRRTYTREYKRAAVKLITDQELSVAEAARRLGITAKLLRRWRAALLTDPVNVFPGRGQLPPVEDELRRLRAEVARLKAERDILKKATALFARESP